MTPPESQRLLTVLSRAAALPTTAAVLACLIVAACSSTAPSPYAGGAGVSTWPASVTDERPRFREIFCSVLAERAHELPGHRSCDDALTRVGTEPGGSGKAVELDQSDRRLVAAIVPGIGWQCIADWLAPKNTAATHLRQFGYDMVGVSVDAMSSSMSNARQVRDAVMAVEPDGAQPRLVLIGYSKGVPDILEAVVSYPEIHGRIAAIVSVSGAVGGSPLAEEVTQSQLELLRHWPQAQCTTGDGGAIDSLRPTVRRAWLAENSLPVEIPLYSVLTCPRPDRISSALRLSYKKLSRLDARNDGMVLLDDQIIPRSTIVACLNADHWAVGVPIARSHSAFASLFVEDNDYPREVLLEAVLRFVEEDLAAATPD
jgi:hypothetical protein